MKRLMMITAFSIITFISANQLALAQEVASSPEAETLATMRKQFAEELRKLRLELLQQGIEFQEWKIKQLERELQQATDKLQRVVRARGVIQQQLAELNEQGGGSAPSEPEQAREVEVVKADLTSKDSDVLLAAQHDLAEQEAGLIEQMKHEQERLQELLSQAKRLKAER